VIFGPRVFGKAIPAAVAVGVAFFLLSCQPRVARKPAEDPFVLAEQYRRQGQFEQAIRAYRRYLEQEPEGEKVPRALHQLGILYSERGRYAKAQEKLKQVDRFYPDYPDMADVGYRIVENRFRMGAYEESKQRALAWLARYPDHPRTGEVLRVLGADLRAMGENETAFHWWLRAKRAFRGDLRKEAELDRKLETLIESSKQEELEVISRYAADTEYAPKAYHRLTRLLMERTRWEKAREAAMALVRSTPEPYWVTIGRELLEQIQEALSVEPGRIGCLLPLSTSFGLYGEEVLGGIELGMDLFGAQSEGGVRELVVKDTANEPNTAVLALEELVRREKVMAVLGPLSSQTATAVARKAQRLGVPLIALSQKAGLPETGGWVFRNFLIPSREVEALLETAMGEMGIERFAIMYPENGYGRFFMNLFWDRLEAWGGEVTAVESYPTDQTDFTEQIRKMTGLYHRRPRSVERRISEARPPQLEETTIIPEEPQPIVDFEAVFIPDNYERVAMIAPQLVYHDVLNVQLLGTSMWHSPKLIELAGDYVQGAIFSSGFFKGAPRASDFVKQYRESFDTDPGILGATGYDTIRLVEELTEKEGVRTRDDFKDALLRHQNFKGTTGEIAFNREGEVRKEPLLLSVSGKRIRLYD